MLNIITRTPIWVWPLFVLLLVLGLRATRERSVPVVLIYLLPLLGVLGLRSVAALPAPVWIWGLFLSVYLVGVWIGFRAQGQWIITRENHLIRVVGEPWTLIAMMLMFWTNFGVGLTRAVAPALYQNMWLHVFIVVLVGLVSGSFAGRAIRVWRG